MFAIYYHPDGYQTNGAKLMGRHAAGESFLRAIFRYTNARNFFVQVEQLEHGKQFAAEAKKQGRVDPVEVITPNSIDALSKANGIYFPGPGIGEQAKKRAFFNHDSWSLCGITHTTSSAGAMDAITELLTSPVQPWDALICTSNAVKDNVNRLLQAQADYLKHRLGITKLILPLLPVIPLGIHTADFKYTEDEKSIARTSLDVDEDTLVVLYMGRLSFHAKAHPLAMYQALEAAAQATGKNVVLVECGWHAHHTIEKAYADAAKAACPSVRVVTLDGRKSKDRQTAWASADVFCSLSDNIQETFGIVPIEAMAAGLPVVVSDWDGYKDTVRDGVDGFRAPTLMPQAGLGGDMALRHALEVDTYDMYCGHTSSLVAVDVQATARAFIKLFNSSELRKKMGVSGLKRAHEVYDWSVIIPQYEALWDKQNEIRLTQGKDHKPLQHPWPARMDPFHSFASYPTYALTPQTKMSLVYSAQETLQHIEATRNLAMVNFASYVLPTAEEITAIVNRAQSGSCTAGDLIQDINKDKQPQAFRSLAWLAKIGAMKLA